jgi:hypothetical protein
MRIATRVTVALLVLGVLLVGALLLATAAIGPGDRRQPVANGGVSRPAADNWRTHNTLLDGMPVAVLLLADFVAAWIGMIGAPSLAVSATVGVLAIDAYLLRRFLRRHAKVPLSA